MIVLLLVFINIHASIQLILPDTSHLYGEEELQAGYDAAKMLSAMDRRSKFRIFDLSEPNAYRHSFQELDSGSTLMASPQNEMSDKIRIRETTHDTIAYTMEQFYSK